MVEEAPEAGARPRTLLLLRHARSEPAGAGVADHERPLAGRGRRDARDLAARAFSGAGATVDLVLCSSARRAIETLAAFSGLIRPGTDVRIDRGLYVADGDGLLDRLRAVEPAFGSALLIGHNPALHDLALRLAGEGEAAGLERLARGLVPGGLVTLLLGGGRSGSAWAALDSGSCRLLRYDLP
ncbi:MAG: SixA phosphatase family protein [Acidimicrobiales bacterium]